MTMPQSDHAAGRPTPLFALLMQINLPIVSTQRSCSRLSEQGWPLLPTTHAQGVFAGSIYGGSLGWCSLTSVRGAHDYAMKSGSPGLEWSTQQWYLAGQERLSEDLQKEAETS